MYDKQEAIHHFADCGLTIKALCTRTLSSPSVQEDLKIHKNLSLCLVPIATGALLLACRHPRATVATSLSCCAIALLNVMMARNKCASLDDKANDHRLLERYAQVGVDLYKVVSGTDESLQPLIEKLELDKETLGKYDWRSDVLDWRCVEEQREEVAAFGEEFDIDVSKTLQWLDTFPTNRMIGARQ